MRTCFVIQPFDKGKFDKRFEDTFSPAIEAAGLRPYRVDRDPGVSVPIDQIEAAIKEASVCFAEITLDNPNVWFELGYAICARKPVCMVCSTERTTTFPFDVQHRTILRYEVASSSDFSRLQADITRHLAAMVENEKDKATITTLQHAAATGGLEPHEFTALALIAKCLDPEGCSAYSLAADMEKAGFTDIAAGLAARSLERQGLVLSAVEQNSFGDGFFTVLRPTDKGIDWLIRNQNKINLRIASKPPSRDDEIPF